MNIAHVPALQTRRLSHAFGVEISGVDLRENLSNETVAAIRRLWNDNGIVLLRGQDITSQQIMHVQSMLAELEGRLAEIANLFDNPNADHAVTHASTARPASRGLRATSRYDPGASLSDTESRQALADALVERGSGGG